MTVPSGERTTTELAALEASARETWWALNRMSYTGDQPDLRKEDVEQIALLIRDLAAELRSRAEQHDRWRKAAEDEGAINDRLSAAVRAAERERDHMRATLERIVSAYSDENEEFLADTVFTTALNALSQPGNTQP